ncbi:MAG: ABC transporter ATP-binding protein [Alphaproteobacteria bacterium]|nr:ABC transporter ATP-binding protein [Alphaproteobacteria bacterium]
MSALDLVGISHHFGKTAVLDTVSLRFDSGSAVAVIGPSGCGKSTLLRLVAGLLSPDRGTVTADGAPVTGPGPERGVVFQQNALFPWLTLAQNIRFGLDEQSMARAEADRRVDQWIQAVGLETFADQRPGALSGGMAQRAALARALAPEPGALLLDEPFGALDRITRGQMQELLVSVWHRTRATLLLITHDVEEALVICDRVVVLSPRPGRVLADLPVDLPRPRTLSDRTSRRFVELRRRLETVLHDAMSEPP